MLLALNQTANTLAFVRLVDFPGGHSKFVVRRDPGAHDKWPTPTVRFLEARPYILSLSLNALAATFCFPGGIKSNGNSVTGLYVSLTNPNLNESIMDQRNVLVLSSSPDLVAWTQGAVLLADDTGFLDPGDSARFTGFHYVDWQFDGEDDLIMAVRTAYRGAVSYHNSNRLTYKRIAQFRSLL